jgi:hypothetical protein
MRYIKQIFCAALLLALCKSGGTLQPSSFDLCLRPRQALAIFRCVPPLLRVPAPN